MTPIDLRQLRYFLHLADEMNFGRAAIRAHISQSSMTEGLQRLEDVLGVRLVDRSRRSVRLTAAGEVLRVESRRVLEQIEFLTERTREAGGVLRERMRIGYSEMALSTPMPKIIQAFRRKYPGADTILSEQSSNGSERALLRGEFDCVFVPSLAVHPSLENLHISDHPVLLCMSNSSTLAQFNELQIEHLRGVPIILPEEGSRFSERVTAAFARADVRPHVVARTSRTTAMLALVAAEVGVCLIPDSLKGLVPDGVKTIPVSEPSMIIPFSLVWRSDPSSDLVSRFVGIAREVIASSAAT